MSSHFQTGRWILAIKLISRCSVLCYAATETTPAPLSLQTRVKSPYQQLPLYFEANRGQADVAVRFIARGPGYSLFLASSEATLILPHGANALSDKRPVISLHLKESNPHPLIEGQDLLPGISNYFIGNNSRKWLTGVAQYSKVAYRQVYPGIDMVYEGDHGQLEYSFIVAPNADPSLIRMNFKGADHLHLDSEGNLVLSFQAGSEASFKAPDLYQQVGHERVSVRGHFVLLGKNLVGFEVGAYDRSKELVIDPTLMYSTYLGGTVDDRAYAIAVDASGNTYITGETTSNLFPGAAGQYQAANGGGASDVFVTKMNAAGTAILWSTYLGGTGDDQGNGIAVDASGNVYITGTTTGGYPVSAPFQATDAGGTDAFVTAINPSGTALIYSTYLGGAGVDGGNGIAVDASGNAFITGHTTSADFPVSVGAFQTLAGGAEDAFVVSFTPAGLRRYASFLGGTTADIGEAIAIDSLDNAYITGLTSNGTFPITPLAPPAAAAFKPTITGPTDAFVSQVNPSGTTLLYSTFVGGSVDDQGTSIAVGAPGIVYITGITYSADFPTINILFNSKRVGQTAISTAPDAFVFKLHIGNGGGTNDGVYSTYLGGTTDDRGLGIVVDGYGDAYVSGHTTSGDYPTVNPLPGQGGLAATGKAVVTEIDPTGASIIFSTYLGGLTDQSGQGIALDASNNIHVAGWTNSTDFPTVVPVQAANAGSFDAFVSKISAPTPPPSSPTGLVGTALGVSSISWNWNAVSGASAYNIYLATSTTTLVISTPTPGFFETGLSTNVAYSRVVTAVVSGLESPLSAAATTYTLAATPGFPIFTNVFYTSFTVTWATNNPAGTRFEVSRSTTNDNFATAVSTPIVFTDSFTLGTTNFSTLLPSTTYYLRVRAENGAAAGAGISTSFSTMASTVTLATPSPTGLTGTALGISSISWSWNAVPVASSYHVDQATSPTTLVISTPSVGFVETGLSSNTAYGRVVSAFINGVESTLSPSATTYTLAATPGTPLFTNVFYTSSTVSWATNNPAGTRFEVSRSTTNDNFATAVSTPIAFTDSFTLGTTNFSGLQPNTTYYLRVRAENGAVAGAGIATAFSTMASTVTLAVPTVTGLNGTALGVSSISWNWNAVSGASAYHIYLATSTTAFVISTPSIGFIETGLSSNTAYGRVVSAIVNGVEGGLSPDATTYTLAATPGAVVFTNVFSTSFTITWATNNPAGTRFEVSRSTTNDNFATAVSTPIAFTDSFILGTTTFSGLIPNATYYLRVRAENGAVSAVVTDFSATQSTVTLSSLLPTGLMGTALSGSSINWIWNAAAGGSAYALYEATSTPTLVGSATTTNFIETGLSTNTAYERVVTTFINGVESGPSASATAYTLAATPGNGVFTNVFSTSFTVTWIANNPTGTRFEVSLSTTNDQFATTVSTPIALTDHFILSTTDFSGLLPDTTYYLRIRAENGAVAGAGIATAFSATTNVVTLSSATSPMLPPPGALSLSPTTGPDSGDTEVIITGTGLLGATSVTFNGQNALSFTIDSDTQITTRSPAEAAGPAVNVMVDRLSGNATAGNYTYFMTSTPSPSGSGTYIYPSPVDGPTATIVYTLAESGTAQIRIYNEVGDLVTKLDDSKPAGTQSSTIQTARLAPGVYFYLLTLKYDSGHSDKHKLKKFAVTHR